MIDNGRLLYLPSCPDKVAQKASLFAEPVSENPEFLRSQIITYIGNKRSLLPFIESGFRLARTKLGKDQISVLDLFSGSGVVARMAKQYAEYLVVNDLERYSCVTNHCYLSNESEVPVREIERWRAFINEFIRDEWAPGFITELYSPVDEEAITASDRVFYTRRNAIFLDVTCQAIGRVPEHLRCYFLAPLLSQASVHVNTSGVFKGFYKSPAGIGQYGGRGRDALARILKDISLPSPIFSNFECPIEVFQSNANDLVRQIDGMDLAYLDPPYNQHPYGSNYFMLNLLCEYRRPDVLSRVSGIPVNWNRSPYNKPQEAEAALFDAIQNCRAKFVLLSYNSEGFVSHQHLLKKLQEIGDVSVFDRRYNTFRGSRNLAERDMHVTEFLYMLDKR